MVIAFAVLMVFFFFAPIVLWWIRNLARVLMKVEIDWISNNLIKIFVVSFAIALILMIPLILAIKEII